MNQREMKRLLEEVDDRYARALEAVSELSTSETDDLLSLLLESRARDAVYTRMLDVSFRLCDGEVTPETVCLTAIVVRDYLAEFGEWPADIAKGDDQAFDDYLADLAEKALGISIDPTTRFRQGDV